MRARVQVVHEVSKKLETSDYKLCLQWVRYLYDDGSMEQGYRFIWRREDGSLQGAMGQARIPRLTDAEALIREARQAGWGDLEGEGRFE
jgi:hypothetical protein